MANADLYPGDLEILGGRAFVRNEQDYFHYPFWWIIA